MTGQAYYGPDGLVLPDESEPGSLLRGIAFGLLLSIPVWLLVIGFVLWAL